MGKLIRASALVLLLACSASAGIITYDHHQPPPPPPPAEQQQELESVTAPDEEAKAESEIPLLIQIALDLFELL
jgi:hypothetical protein